MSSINKVIIYACDTCKRQTEIQLDGNRPDPQRCNITYRCRGKLQRVAERATKQFLFTPPVSGLQDYVQRGTVADAAVSTVTPEIASLLCGKLVMTAGVLRRIVTGPSTHAFIFNDVNGIEHTAESLSISFPGPKRTKFKLTLYEIADDLLRYRKYTFARSGMTQLIVGVDDSASPMTLNFTIDNYVRVFVNGVELNETQFNRDIDNQITLTPAVYDTSNVVEVFVYEDLTASYQAAPTVELVFDAIDSTNVSVSPLLAASAWGDHLAVTTADGSTRYLLHCAEISRLSPDHSYGVLKMEMTDVHDVYHEIDPVEVVILMADVPYAYQDKQLYAYLSGVELINNTTSLAFIIDDSTGERVLTVEKTHVTDLFNPLAPVSPIVAPDQTITVTTNTTLKRQFILGPV